MPSVSSIIDFVKSDMQKIIRFAAVSAITVPVGLLLFWLFLQTSMPRVVANILAVTLSTIPNYLLNRYWVWNKRGVNSLSREVAPFWMMAFLGLVLSSLLVLIANIFTDEDFVFLAANFLSYGILWVFKFFVLEKYLFGTTHAAAEVEATA